MPLGRYRRIGCFEVREEGQGPMRKSLFGARLRMKEGEYLAFDGNGEYTIAIV